MEVTEDIEVSTERLVPLCDSLVDGNVNPSNSATITNGVSVVKSNLEPVDVEVRVVPRGDDELHPRLTLEVVSKEVVHVELQRVSVLGGEPCLLCRAGVVPTVTRDDEVVHRVVQNVLNARGNHILNTDNCVDGLGVGELHEVGMDVSRVEVTEESEDNRLNLDILCQDVREPKPCREEGVHPSLCDSGSEVVEVVDGRAFNSLIGVPVRGNPHCGGFRTGSVLLRLDDVGVNGSPNCRDGSVLL